MLITNKRMAEARRQALLAAMALAQLLAARAAAEAAPDPSPRPVQEKRSARKPPAEPVVYANCREARDAGAAPIRRGDPGYSRKLDRDGDGVACE